MGIVSKRLRDSARGQQCTLQVGGVCNNDPETTVLAHMPGGGMATKSDDFFAVFACSACHEALDNGRLLTMTPSYCLRALERTLRHWVVNGDLIIAGAKSDKPHKVSGKMMPARRPLYGRK